MRRRLFTLVSAVSLLQTRANPTSIQSIQYGIVDQGQPRPVARRQTENHPPGLRLPLQTKKALHRCLPCGRSHVGRPTSILVFHSTTPSRVVAPPPQPKSRPMGDRTWHQAGLRTGRVPLVLKFNNARTTCTARTLCAMGSWHFFYMRGLLTSARTQHGGICPECGVRQVQSISFSWR